MVKKHSDDYQDFSYITNPFLGSTPRTLKKHFWESLHENFGICSGKNCLGLFQPEVPFLIPVTYAVGFLLFYTGDERKYLQ